jgi:segregation and condensation protein A
MLAPRLTWTVHTEVFDGPLDLLLYLVKRDGIDLREVSIARVADSYLDFLDRMRELHISVASDYLVMAATLCHLKSLELLPRPPSILEEEEVDPREELARRLEAYEQFKEAAESLEALPRLDRDVFVREPLDVGEVDRPLIPGVDAFGLLDVYYKVLTRPEPAAPTHTIHKPEVDFTGCCRRVLEVLGGPGGEATLRDILTSWEGAGERVITFIAVLEMVRLQWIGLEQSGHLAPVNLVSRVPVDQDLEAVTGDVSEAAAG